MVPGHIGYIRLSGQGFPFPVKGLPVVKFSASACRQDFHIAAAVITAIIMLGFLDSRTLLEHHADLCLKAICVIPDLRQLLTAEIIQAADGGNEVIDHSGAHILQPDLHYAAVGRTAAEHEGLIHELTEGL